MLREFLGIRDQFFFEAPVFFFAQPPAAGTRDWTHRDLTFLKARQNLRGGADNLEIIEIQKIHVGRGIHRAQRAVQRNRLGLIGDRQAL